MTKSRNYSMSLREEQAAATRRRILAAATESFVGRGYLGTTLAEVARAAGVSVQTVYNLVGGKPVLLKAAYDVTLAGDDEPVPLAQRPAMIAMREADTARGCLAGYAAVARMIGERVLPLGTMIFAQASTGDPDLAEVANTLRTEHAIGTERVATHVAERFGLRPGLDVAGAADVLWALTSLELAERLVTHRGWSWARYEDWLAVTLGDALTGDGRES